MKVFIADDSPLIRERLRDMLTELSNVDVIGEAEHGGEARDRILQLKPDMAILDIRMPNRMGIDVLREIKHNLPDLKVIMLTNYPYPHFQRRCEEEGADYFFDKSTEFEKVTQVVQQLASDQP
ncbi:response regulator transcription factor [Candidatus Neomarinimicrobiota bacterium]